MKFEGNVNFFFDPTCPWTFVASQWIKQVSNEAMIPITYRPFSLAIKNKDADIPEPYRTNQLNGLPLLRMVIKLQQLGQGQSPLIGELYRQFAKSYHLDGDKATSAVEVGKSLGLSSEVTASHEDTELDSYIESEMSYALSFTGNDVGVPIIVVEDEFGTFGFFGPILHRRPDVEHSVKLFNALVDLAQIECFSELKRKRTNVDVGDHLVL
ncbi:MAG: hypothetical protein M0019_02255 [Actinomycetota bacterium]|nr:hypothetical protein [Actinomycetota bacterium]